MLKRVTSPSGNWLEKNGLTRAEGRTCAVCGWDRDIGKRQDREEPVCCIHARCTLPAVTLIARCRHERTQVTAAQFDAGRWNSYDRDAMIPVMETTLIVRQIAHVLLNCPPLEPPGTTWYDALQLYAYEAAARLQLYHQAASATRPAEDAGGS